jgi:hypothetical protein
MRVSAAAKAVNEPERSLFRAVKAGRVPSLPDEDGVTTVKLTDVEAWAASRKSANHDRACGSACTPTRSAPTANDADAGMVAVAAPAVATVPGDASKLTEVNAAVDSSPAVAGLDLEEAVAPALVPPASSFPPDPLVQELAGHFARLEDTVVALSSTVTSTGKEVDRTRAENSELADRVVAVEQAVTALRNDFIALNQLVAFLLSCRR